MSDYEERFSNHTVEQKRQSLIADPFFDAEKLKEATDEQIVELHKYYNETLVNVRTEMIVESMFNGDF